MKIFTPLKVASREREQAALGISKWFRAAKRRKKVLGHIRVIGKGENVGRFL